MSYCESQTVVNGDDTAPDAASILCKRWSCPTCQPIRQAQLKTLARDGQPGLFLTLTYKINNETTTDIAASELVRAWRITVKRIKRKYQITRLPYLAVMEATKNGWPHLHILIRMKWISQKFVSDCMAEIINSPIVWIETIQNNGRVAAYVAKYIGKAPHHFEGCKRYWRSLDWIADPDEVASRRRRRAEHPVVVRWKIRRVAERLKSLGYRIEWEHERAFQAWSPASATVKAGLPPEWQRARSRGARP